LAQSSPKVFIREATGLVREFSALDLFFYNLYNSAIGVTIAVMPSIFSGLFPQADPTTAIILGAFIAWSSGWVLMILSIVMPRSGGDYIFNTRILSPSIGFTTNWILQVTSVFLLGLFGSWIGNFGLADAFLNYGYATGNVAAVNLGTLVATPVYTFTIGAVSIVLLGFIMLGGPRYAKRFFLVAFFPALASLIISIGLFATSSNSAFISAFNKFASQYTNQTDSYNFLTKLASSLGYSPVHVNFGATFFAAIFSSIVLYIGYQFSAYLGGETKRAGKSQPVAVIAGLLATAISLVIAAKVYYSVVGSNFQNSITYISSNYPSNFTLPVSPTYNFFAGLLTVNPVLIGIMGVGFVAWFVMLVFTVWLQITRSTFAWSFDRLLPNAFSKIYEGTGAPWVIILVTGFFAILFLYIYTFALSLTALVNTSLLYSLVFLITGVSALILPWRKKELFNSSPSIVRWSIGGFPLISVAGIINIVLYALLFYLSILYPTISGPISPSVFELIVAVVIIGFAAFYIARAVRIRQGIQIDLAFKEIPPE
jgi:APA family basic amino acid/polyamine antiporter